MLLVSANYFSDKSSLKPQASPPQSLEPTDDSYELNIQKNSNRNNFLKRRQKVIKLHLNSFNRHTFADRSIYTYIYFI